MNIDECFVEMFDSILKQVKSFKKNYYKDDYHELLSTAYLSFHTFINDTKNQDKLNYLYNRIKLDLLDELREHNRKIKRQLIYSENIRRQEEYNPIWLLEFQESLSKEAACLVTMILQNKKLWTNKKQIREHLKEQGWARRTIVKTFDEIERQLCQN